MADYEGVHPCAGQRQRARAVPVDAADVGAEGQLYEEERSHGDDSDRVARRVLGRSHDQHPAIRGQVKVYS